MFVYFAYNLYLLLSEGYVSQSRRGTPTLPRRKARAPPHRHGGDARRPRQLQPGALAQGAVRGGQTREPVAGTTRAPARAAGRVRGDAPGGGRHRQRLAAGRRVAGLREGSRAAQDWAALLDVAKSLVAENDGVPLAPRTTFAGTDAVGTLVVTTDASVDGLGGYAFTEQSPGGRPHRVARFGDLAERRGGCPAAGRRDGGGARRRATRARGKRPADAIHAGRGTLRRLGGGRSRVRGGGLSTPRDRGSGRLRPGSRGNERGVQRISGHERGAAARTGAGQPVAGGASAKGGQRRCRPPQPPQPPRRSPPRDRGGGVARTGCSGARALLAGVAAGDAGGRQGSRRARGSVRETWVSGHSERA
eukprot:916866-Pleurochrysis_carterae.AAC.1